MARIKSYRNFDEIDKNNPLAEDFYKFSIMICNVFIYVSVFCFSTIFITLLASNAFYTRWAASDVFKLLSLTFVFLAPIFFGIKLLRSFFRKRLRNIRFLGDGNDIA